MTVAAKSLIWVSLFPFSKILFPLLIPTSCCLCLNVLPAIGPILHKIPIMGEQPTLRLRQELFCFFHHLSAARQVTNCVATYGCCRKHIYKRVIHLPRSLLWLLHRRYSGWDEGSFCTSIRELILAASLFRMHTSASGWSARLPVVVRLLKC